MIGGTFSFPDAGHSFIIKNGNSGYNSGNRRTTSSIQRHGRNRQPAGRLLTTGFGTGCELHLASKPEVALTGWNRVRFEREIRREDSNYQFINH